MEGDGGGAAQELGAAAAAAGGYHHHHPQHQEVGSGDTSNAWPSASGEQLDPSGFGGYTGSEDTKPAAAAETASPATAEDASIANEGLENGGDEEEALDAGEGGAAAAPVAGGGAQFPESGLEEKDGNPDSEGTTSEEDCDGTTEEQLAFVKELDTFFRDRNLEFKPPKFYGVELNCLKLWKAVMKLGGYEQVTAGKLWRQVGESFNPPVTCTTISWSFRGFYEKALLEYERFKTGVSLNYDADPSSRGVDNQDTTTQLPSGSKRARRDAAARAMQGWHTQRAEVAETPLRDRSSSKRDKRAKNSGVFKRKDGSGKGKSFNADEDNNHFKKKVPKQELMKAKGQNGIDLEVIDEGPQADWVKINVHQSRDCFEVYALVPGLLREEVRIQCEGGGRLVIAGEPEQPDNPWGVTAFRKVINLPLRIDAHQTSAVVTLHGQLFIRVPFAQPDAQQ